MNFKKGDKVIVIDDTLRDMGEEMQEDGFKKGNVYTVEKVTNFNDLRLEGCIGGYDFHRFELVDVSEGRCAIQNWR